MFLCACLFVCLFVFQYLQYGEGFVHLLDGKFSFALYDGIKDTYFVARDPIGVTSLYQGWAKDGSVWFASELKALHEECEKIEPFEPGTSFSSTNGVARWYNPVWFDEVVFWENSSMLA